MLVFLAGVGVFAMTWWVPGIVWVVVLLLLTLGALAAGAQWLIGDARG